MGCGSSVVANETEFFQIQVNKSWDKAMTTLVVKRGDHYNDTHLVVRRSGWKTIRVFVSSTFKDFHPERETLVKKVFPDLRVWCEQRRLNLIECDLRWGVPADFNVEGTLRACLGEIDRCYQDNIMPFFLNMTSERAGWVPVEKEVPGNIRSEYTWVDGLSVTEMEIMHGAYRNDNPNSLFLLRNPDFLDTVPEAQKKVFVDGNPIAPAKLNLLKKMIEDRFPEDRVIYYDVGFDGVSADTGIPQLSGLDGMFSQKVFDFFKERINKQYPEMEGDLDPYHQLKEQHESFMKNRADCVLGRDAILKKIQKYITGIGNDIPLLLLGGPGSGKSSVMAKAADVATNAAVQGKIPGGGKDGWHVFYHFVGAVPGSTELEEMLKRFLKEMKVCDDSTMPKDLDTASMMACGALNNPNTRPVILIVDALNQMDDDKAAKLVSWVPRKLAPHIRCVFSMIPDTPQHKAFKSREPLPEMIPLEPLDVKARGAIVDDMLGKYNKRLDKTQKDTLLSKSASANPLWLAMACEELRVFGNFRQVSDKINQLPDELIELEKSILSRFEKENGGELLVATLCLLEVSGRGLLEVELLSILADEENLRPQPPEENSKEKGSEKADKGSEKGATAFEKLPAYKWAEVYRALKPYIRPFGDSGEGRLDFYHRSISKAVRAKYFKDSDGNDKEDIYNWWHTELADFFEHVTQLPRKIEEYPVHLIAIKDKVRLASFLCEWDVFDSLYNEDHSTRLAYLWRTGCDAEYMESCYETKVNNMANDPDVDLDVLGVRLEKVSRFLAQAGRYPSAKKLLKRAQDLETGQLGSRKERLEKLYHLTGSIINDELRMENYFDQRQVEPTREFISYYEKCVELLEGCTNKQDLKRLGLIHDRLSFHYSNLKELESPTYDDEEGEDVNMKRAYAHVEMCAKIFKEDLEDNVMWANSITTKGGCIGREGDGNPQELKCYDEARSILLPVVGELSYMYIRTVQNAGIYYERIGQYENALELFYKWYELCRDLYGHDHPSTRPAVESCREYHYVQMLNAKGLPVPRKHPLTDPDSDDDDDFDDENGSDSEWNPDDY